MDPVLLARIQFALTPGFHFIFLPLTIGLAWLVFAFLTKYKNTGRDSYRRVAQFWLGLLMVSFVVSVATGITTEFRFGTNWSEYSRFVGDIFGAPLAAEGIFAFFLESVFIGVLIFGWKRLSVKTMWFSAGRVAQLHRNVSVLIEPLRRANRTYRARHVRRARRALPGGEAGERGSAECPAMGQCGGYALFWLLLISVAATVRTQPQLMQNYNAHLALWLLPLVIAVSGFLSMLSAMRGRLTAAFGYWALTIVMVLASVAAGLFPRMVPALNDPARSLTLYNASSSQLTLTVMLVLAIIGMPLVIGYTVWAYRAFSGKASLEDGQY